MKTVPSHKGRRRNFLIFLYLACSSLALAPTIMAPPESGFQRGQPEMQQAMDNMLAREQMIKKDLQFPYGDAQGYPALLTHKTSTLLSEAEHMLNRVKNLKERRWVEAFVHRLKLLSSVLEQSVVGQQLQETEGKNVTTAEIAQPVNKSPLSNDSILPTPSALQQNSTVPKIGHKQQDNKLTSKYPVTVPQMDQVMPMNEDPSDHQVVTKPGLVQPLPDKKSFEEEDELVKELEDLHKIAASNDESKNSTTLVSKEATIPEVPEEMPSGAPRKRTGVIHEDDFLIEREKAKIKAHLAQEVSELHRLGESDQDIMNTFHLNGPRFHGPMYQNMMFYPRPNAGMMGPVNNGAIQKVKDVNANEFMISRAIPNVWRPVSAVYPPYHPLKQSYPNNSFQGMHIAIAPLNQQVLTRQFQNDLANDPIQANLQLFHEGIKNTIQNLQKQHQNFLLKNHLAEMPQNAQYIPSPPVMRQGQFMQPNKFLANPNFGPQNVDQSGKSKFPPYPYFQNINKNLTVHESQPMNNPFIPNFPNHNIDSEFSDEMKRELRDGKVILLSDSVVRSHFDPDPKQDPKEKGKEITIKEDETKKKNETQAQN